MPPPQRVTPAHQRRWSQAEGPQATQERLAPSLADSEAPVQTELGDVIEWPGSGAGEVGSNSHSSTLQLQDLLSVPQWPNLQNGDNNRPNVRAVAMTEKDGGAES